ncbi:hypothetical protein Skr01_33710 [Sphaerisporangium krabiense]|uniref:Uncharacterized protein n=1 Tax=Sphaerisporangium krabiense TaxID=763782 RepID=A0A7W8Z3A6_9ACTN|nr:hypothetical protein [Sphaerisporangium krabiense]MBB5626368.1 hypothetical protein [Sphaerisporangium krabiense]GII63286.1 hypothetical protein Skr01_33710 [Sphaerisporangium krabiense]
MRRPKGRHCAEGEGQSPRVNLQTPHRWDPAKTAAAAMLDQAEPGWFIFYGVGTRRFVAIAMWNAPSALRVEAPTLDELREQMREAELGATAALSHGRTWVA